MKYGEPPKRRKGNPSPVLTQARNPIDMRVRHGRDGTPFSQKTRRWLPTAVPGIVITPEMHPDGTSSNIAYRPCLTHQSGKLIGGPYVSIRQATLVAVVLGGFFGNDWTGESKAMRSWVDRRAQALGIREWFRDIIKPQQNFAGENIDEEL